MKVLIFVLIGFFSWPAIATDYETWQKQIGINKVNNALKNSLTMSEKTLRCDIGCFTSNQCSVGNSVTVYDITDNRMSAYRVTFPRANCKGIPRIDDYFIASWSYRVDDVHWDGSKEIIANLIHYVDGVMRNRSKRELRMLPVKGINYRAAYRMDKNFNFCASLDLVRHDKPLLLTQTAQPMPIDYENCLRRIF